MFIINKYPLISTKSESLINNVKDYLSLNKCCVNYPKCIHPKIQSNPNILFDERFKDLLDEVSLCLKQASNEMLKTENNTEVTCWAFFQQKGTTNNTEKWHNHLYDDLKNQISFLIYLTPTDLGTIFINDYEVKQILVPEMNFIFIWDSKYVHSPALGKINEDRIVLAGNYCF